MADKRLIKELFYTHYGEMTHLARTLLYSDEEAEDVVQDVFTRLMEADILPAKDKARAYLLSAVRNGCLNCIRRKSLTERVKSLYPLEMDGGWQGADDRMAKLDAVCNFAESHLKEPHRTIFRLRFKEGLKLREIATELDMNIKTVYKYLSQSIKDIQRQFRHESD